MLNEICIAYHGLIGTRLHARRVRRIIQSTIATDRQTGQGGGDITSGKAALHLTRTQLRPYVRRSATRRHRVGARLEERAQVRTAIRQSRQWRRWHRTSRCDGDTIRQPRRGGAARYVWANVCTGGGIGIKHAGEFVRAECSQTDGGCRGPVLLRTLWITFLSTTRELRPLGRLPCVVAIAITAEVRAAWWCAGQWRQIESS